MKKIYTFLTAIALLTFCFIDRSVADRLLLQHPVTRTNAASQEGHRKGEIETSVEKAIHDVSESQAKSTVSSAVSISCNVNGSFVGVAQIKGTADTGASGFLADSYDEIASGGIPITLTTTDLDKYQGKSGNSGKTAYVLRLSGVNSSLLFTGIKRHGVLLDKGFDLVGIPLFSRKQDLNFSENASTVKQKGVGMTDAEIIAMFSPYASANGSSLTDGGASNEAHVPSVSADTSMSKDSRSDEDDDDSEDDTDDDSEGDDDTGSTDNGGTITYACNVHSGASSDASDHTLQASCPWDSRCISTNFYMCQHTAHEYPAHLAACGHPLPGHSVMPDHGCGFRHYSCQIASLFALCPRSPSGEKCNLMQGLHLKCLPHTCQYPTSENTNTNGNNGNANSNGNNGNNGNDGASNDSPQVSSARPSAVCGSGHTYFTDGSYARNQHQDRTCLRCSLTYQNCSNHATACQNTRWHTQDDTAYMDGGCGHNYRINEKSQHASVTCTTTNANGDTCMGGSYYACQSHTHTYPSSTTPTPTPSPPENSNPNNNEEEEEEEVPAAPPAPPVPYHPCGQHLTTVPGNHSLQASCSRDRNCIASSFYWCQHTSHTYPAPPPPMPTVVCPADSWTNCDGTTSHASTCTGGHSYYTCGTENAWHQDRTCTRCSQTYQNCGNSASACQSSYWHTETPQPVLVACGAASWTSCTERFTSSATHRVTCSGGHSYWTCGTANDWHQDRTCSRCSQTYQKCTNTSTSCQGSRWHIE